ncbi:MAG: hypothetical protein AAF250_05485 [Pseudomonadota bacterium]
MRNLIALLFITLSLACAPTNESDVADEDSSLLTVDPEGADWPDRIPNGRVITSVGDLLGEYQVTYIDERPVAGGLTIDVSVDGPLLSFDPICAGFIWEVGFDGEELSLSRHKPRFPEPVLAPGEVPPPAPVVCAIAVPQDMSELADAFDAATRAERNESGDIRIAGGGRSVLLTRK